MRPAALGTDMPPKSTQSSCLHFTVAGCVSGLYLRADLLSEGFCLLQLIPCVWEVVMAGLNLPGIGMETVKEAPRKRVLMPKRGPARSSPAQGFPPPCYNHPSEQKIRVNILTSTSASRILKTKTISENLRCVFAKSK